MKMQYRPVGQTGLQASVVGLGAEHLDGKPYPLVEEVIQSALECGINIMDLFMPGDEVRANIGRALAGNRDKMLIQGHIGSVSTPREQYDISRDPEVCKRQFDRLLHHLGTDYIDIGMLFFMDTERDIEEAAANGIIDYALELKKQGVIRCLGASAHNPATAVRMVRLGVLDLLMFSINPAFDLMDSTHDITTMLGTDFAQTIQAVDTARAELYRLCESRGVAITVMKALGAGKLLSAQHTPFSQPLTPAQCIHYALSRPAVVSVLVGCQSREQVLAAAAYPGLSEAEKDYSTIIASIKGDFKGSCVYCGHCQPCPQGIDIAAVNKYLDIARLSEQDIPLGPAAHYRALSRHGGDCVACGHCEKRCPFGTPVIENMRLAAELFGQ